MIDIKQHSVYGPMESDSVISAIFNIYFKRFWVLFIVSFLAAFFIQMSFYQLGFFGLTKITDPEELLKMIFSIRTNMLIGSIIYFMLYGSLFSFLVNYLIKIDLDPELNIKDLFIESIKKYAVHVIFFFIISMIIILAGASIGVLILIVGALVALIYLGTILVPGSAIIIAEEKNAIESVGRTFQLVHKDFWSTLGAAILFILVMILFSILLSAIMAIPLIVVFFDRWQDAESLREIFNSQIYDIGIWSVLLNALASAVTYPLYAIFSVVIYLKLRYKEEERIQRSNY